MPQRAYPILTDNTSGLLPVCGAIVCKEKQYDFYLTVYFSRMAFCKVSIVSVDKRKSVRQNRESQEDTCKGKVSNGNFFRDTVILSTY